VVRKSINDDKIKEELEVKENKKKKAYSRGGTNQEGEDGQFQDDEEEEEEDYELTLKIDNFTMTPGKRQTLFLEMHP